MITQPFSSSYDWLRTPWQQLIEDPVWILQDLQKPDNNEHMRDARAGVIIDESSIVGNFFRVLLTQGLVFKLVLFEDYTT